MVVAGPRRWITPEKYNPEYPAGGKTGAVHEVGMISPCVSKGWKGAAPRDVEGKIEQQRGEMFNMCASGVAV